MCYVKALGCGAPAVTAVEWTQKAHYTASKTLAFYLHLHIKLSSIAHTLPRYNHTMKGSNTSNKQVLLYRVSKVDEREVQTPHMHFDGAQRRVRSVQSKSVSTGSNYRLCRFLLLRGFRSSSSSSSPLYSLSSNSGPPPVGEARLYRSLLKTAEGSTSERSSKHVHEAHSDNHAAAAA